MPKSLKIRMPINHLIRKGLLGVALILLSLGGCSRYLKFKAGAKPEAVPKIERMAIGKIQVHPFMNLKLNDHKGDWSQKSQNINLQGFGPLLQQAVVANLSRFSGYRLLVVNELETLASPKTETIHPAAGFKTEAVDAYLKIDAYVSSLIHQGIYQKRETFTHKESAFRISRRGPRWVTIRHNSHQRVVDFPYQVKTWYVVLHAELIDTKGGNYRLIKSLDLPVALTLYTGTDHDSFAQGDPKGFFDFWEDREKEERTGSLPFYAYSHYLVPTIPAGDALPLQRLAMMLAAKLSPHLAPYQVVVQRTLDTSGDDEAVEFLEKAQVPQAKRRLETMIATKNDIEPADLYNLGICYEALGEVNAAMTFYEDALKKDEDNSTYIQAMGELEQLYFKP